MSERKRGKDRNRERESACACARENEKVLYLRVLEMKQYASVNIMKLFNEKKNTTNEQMLEFFVTECVYMCVCVSDIKK